MKKKEDVTADMHQDREFYKWLQRRRSRRAAATDQVENETESKRNGTNQYSKETRQPSDGSGIMLKWEERN